MLCVEDAFGCPGQQLGEHALAIGESGPAQIEPVHIQQVEGVVEQPIPATGGEVGVKQPEIRDAARIRDHGFAIQDQAVRRQSRERIGDTLKAERPVVAPPCIHGRLSVVQVRLCSVAVELDLVHPALA